MSGVVAIHLCVLLAVLIASASSSQAVTLPPLPPHMADHKYIFIVGAHHSGTTIMDLILCQHPDATCLLDTHKPENEGQHLQTVYKAANKLGGMLRFAFNNGSYLDETSELITEDNREDIFRAWATYWDLERSALVEKSPPHLLKTRFFQTLFTPERTYFLMTIRHPLACTHFRYGKSTRSLRDCGEHYIRHWLTMYDTALRDAEFLEHVAVVQFEDFLDRSHELTLGYVKEIEDFVELPNAVELIFASPDDASSSSSRQSSSYANGSPQVSQPSGFQAPQQAAAANGRHLLEYHGNKHHVEVNFGHTTSWVKDWTRIADMSSPLCQSVIDKYETRLNFYGYSLKNLTHFENPKAFHKYLLKFEALQHALASTT
eukprot:m.23038 g.23038  ORF g.23038 m.23038 type:complete len:374 (-) comp9413_c0_seq2:160-1281(-)